MEEVFDTERDIAPLELDGVVPFPEDFAKKYREKGYWEGQTLSEMFSALLVSIPIGSLRCKGTFR